MEFIPRERCGKRGNQSAGHFRRQAPIALDAKVTIDDNAIYRHPELSEFKDMEEEDRMEYCAINTAWHTSNWTVIFWLHGKRRPGDRFVGCSEAAGGKPANFLDIGGG